MTTNEAATIIMKHRYQLLDYAKRLCYDPTEAEDLLSMATLRAITYIDKYADQGHKFLSWFYTVLRNTFLNEYKSKNRHPVVTIDGMAFGSFNSSKFLVRNEGYDNVLAEDIIDCMKDLPEDNREILLLACEGFKYEEIVEKTGISLFNVRYKLMTARKVVKKNIIAKYSR